MDTHRDAHVAAVLSLQGAVTGIDEFPATATGYRELLWWARGLGAVRRAGVEGIGSFGAALSPHRLTQGVEVFDANRPDLRRRDSELLRTCARLGDDSQDEEDGAGAVMHATRVTLCLPAHRIGQLTEQIQDLEGRRARLVKRHAPQLLAVVALARTRPSPC